jgi:hypothetical protein
MCCCMLQEWWDNEPEEPSIGTETCAFFAPFYAKTPSFYQYRLGTNIGKVEGKHVSAGNGSAKDFEERMAVYLHRKRLQETTSAIDLSAPVKPCWHYTQAGDLKKRRRDR